MKDRKTICNLLADFILLRLGDESKSIVQVIDSENFFIVKGKTDYKEILKLNEILDEFYKKYDQIEPKQKNVIDLMEYDVELEFPNEFILKFKKSENISDFDSQDGPFVYSSHFPFGHSLSPNRIYYYYFKNIVYNIPSDYFFHKIIFTCRLESFKLEFDIWDDFNSEFTDSLKSAILDCFDFDLVSFKEELKKNQLDFELIDPSKDLELLKKKKPNFIIV